MALKIEFAGRRPVVDPGAFVAPTLVLVGDVTVAAGASVWYGAVLRADFGPIVVGAGSNVQDNCVLHAAEGLPTVLEDEVTVGHLATMESWVIEHGALIGMGAVVLQRARVGRGSVVAAGSVVAEDAQIPPRRAGRRHPRPGQARTVRQGEAVRPHRRQGVPAVGPPLSGRSPGRPADIGRVGIGRVGIGRLAAICWRRA
jgi:carbonic anhydrase/acetyltransferase-like protein (isoleucine patch superfamily)